MKDTLFFEQLRRAWQEMDGPAGPGSGCPEPDLIWEALAGGLAPEEVRRIVAHTASCPLCAQAWRLARDMGAMEGQAPARAEPERRRRATAFRLRPLALAAGLAGLLVCGAAAVWLWPQPARQEVRYRAQDQGSIRALTAERTPLPRSACLLRWTPGPPGTRYTVRVSTEDLAPVSVAEGLERPEYRVPPAALQRFGPGQRLLWQVEAFLPQGGREFSETFFVVIE